VDGHPPVGEQDRRRPENVERANDLTRALEQIQPERDEARRDFLCDLGD